MPFQIIRNDIVKVKADAIVNTANPRPIYAGAVDRSIYLAAGAEDLLKEREKIGPIPVGEAAWTPAFKLPAKYIIHTVGPVWEDGEHGEVEAVRSCYRNSLRIASELKCKSIAFPLIATGAYGFPKDKALEAATSVIYQFLLQNEMLVYLVIYDQSSLDYSSRLFTDVKEYIDANYIEKKEEQAIMAAAEGDTTVGGTIVQKAFERGHLTRAEADRLAAHRRRVFDRNDRIGGDGRVYGNDRIGGDGRVYGNDRIGRDGRGDGNDKIGGDGSQGKSTKEPSLEQMLAGASGSFGEILGEMIKERGLKNSEVYNAANVSKQTFSKILNSENVPKRETVAALAIGLKLTVPEAEEFYRAAGYAMTKNNKFDVCVRYFLSTGQYNIVSDNIILFDNGMPLLGAKI